MAVCNLQVVKQLPKRDEICLLNSILVYCCTLKKAAVNVVEDIFYSKVCTSQQKTKFMLTSFITYKFLTTKHAQNEGDNAFSLIEWQAKRQLSKGLIYTPVGYISPNRVEKKQGELFHVN